MAPLDFLDGSGRCPSDRRGHYQQELRVNAFAVKGERIVRARLGVLELLRHGRKNASWLSAAPGYPSAGDQRP